MSDSAFLDGAFIDEVAAILAAGDLSGALALAEQAIAVEATHVAATGALAAIAFRSGQPAQSLMLLELIKDENAKSSDVPELLAILNCLVGRLNEALYYGKLATIVPPDGTLIKLFGPGLPAFAAAFRSISERPLLRQARTCIDQGAQTEALGQLEQHLELFPNDVAALDLYADTLITTGQTRKAIAILRTVLTLAGPSATLLGRLGHCLTEIGELGDALACHREAVARGPKAIALHTKLLYDWGFHPQAGGADIEAAIAKWQAALQANMPKVMRRPPTATVKDTLCVTYLCAGSLDADTKAMLRRIVLAHDRSKVKVLGFGCGSMDNPANIAFRGAFDQWRDISALDELTLAALIRGEGTDVAVNVDGLLGPGHVGVFARNCAPVQLSWLNLGDGIALPGAHGSLATAGLPTGPLLLQAAGRTASREDSDAPSFGADCTLAELNSEVVRVWSSILHAIPNSTLTLADHGFSASEAVDRLIQRFGNFGVAHRVDVNSGRDPAALFAQVDVALAPFPATRPTPYGIALSMGIPVIAMNSGRAGLLCQALKATEAENGMMVAADAAEYLAKAVAFATDPALRAGLPDAAASAVYSEKAFTAGLEAFYRETLIARAAAQ